MNRQCSSRLTTSLSFDLTWLCLDLAGCSLTDKITYCLPLYILLGLLALQIGGTINYSTGKNKYNLVQELGHALEHWGKTILSEQVCKHSMC